MPVRIYHNPRCNTSRKTLALLREKGVEPEIVEYLKTPYTAAQLKIMQEVITLVVFAPFAVFVLGQPMKLDYLWAGMCMVGAVYFIFRNG